ncbi:hypothetical protein SOVF_130200, partial [Spinacia oleracea]
LFGLAAVQIVGDSAAGSECCLSSECCRF